MKISAVLLGILLAAPVYANDSAISGASGTPGNLKATQLAGEHKTIRMVREHVDIKVGRTDYVTDANFVFHNSGAATTVRMGFPENSGGDTDDDALAKGTAFKEFQTWVDGSEVKATRMGAVPNSADFTFDTFWVKSVTFQRGQTRKVRVRYRSPLGTSTDGNFVAYDFTGGNWRGKVDESTLRLTFTVPGTYRVFPVTDEAGNQRGKYSGNSILFTWRNWEADSGFALRFLHTLPNGLVRAHDEEDLNRTWDTYDNLKMLTVSGTGAFDPWKAAVNWPPAAVLRDGRTFIQFRLLSDVMREKWEHERNGGKPSTAAGLYVRDGLYISSNYGGPGILSFTPGSRTATIGAQTVTLSAAPFLAGGAFHVPLAATVEALNGRVKVNTKTQRFWFDVPIKG